MNLLDVLKNQLTEGSTLGAISNLLGESQTATKSGLSAALPALLGSVIQKGSTADGASSLLNLIKGGGHDGSILNNIGGLLSGGAATNNLLSSGGSLITSLLGDKVGGIVNFIANFSGMKGGSVSSLLNLAAPMLMGLISKQVTSQGLGASGLANLLMGQASSVKAAMPAGLSNVLGFSNMGDVKAATANVEEAATGFGKWLPWLLALAVLGGLLYFWKGCEDVKAPNVAKAVEATKEAAKDAGTAVADAAKEAVVKVGEMFKVSLPGGVVLDVPKGSLEDGMVAFIQSKDTISKNKWFDFDRLTFETNKATLKPESSAQLANVAAIMKAFPTAKIKIGGYTDNVGNAASNLKLSADRAKNVMGELVKLGTAAARMESEGYGDQHPVADNKTEEGKAKNRRISISVRAK